MARKKKSSVVPFQPYESKSQNGTERGYIRLTPSQFHSDAVMDLSPNAFRIFVSMKFRSKGHREVIYTYENAGEDASISRQTFLNVLDELTRMKLIKRIPTHAYAPSMFEFIEEWKSYYSPRRDLITGKRNPKKKNSNRKQPQKKSR